MKREIVLLGERRRPQLDVVGGLSAGGARARLLESDGGRPSGEAKAEGAAGAGSSPGARGEPGGGLVYFLVAVLGFSVWFLMAVPFASHRETYWWLAMVREEKFAQALSFISSTYRPLHQVATWSAFLLLDVNTFPTDVWRQTGLQLLVYGLFVGAWWLIYRSAAQPRVFAVCAFLTGGVFFSGYVQLFHVYGIAYVAVMFVLGAVLMAYARGTLERWALWLGAGAMLLVVWHPFATALFVGAYGGFYLEGFRRRARGAHVWAISVLLVGLIVIAGAIVLLPRWWAGATPLLVETATRPLGTRIAGLLVSYRTNEVNAIASVLALLLACVTVIGAPWSRRLKAMTLSLVSGLGVVFFVKGWPLLLIWLGVGAVKLATVRRWGLLGLMGTSILLPLGGGIGSPIYGLFAIIMGAYATAHGWAGAEKVLSFARARYVIATVAATIVMTGVVRAGGEIPLISPGARPLLMEREKTYQLESILAWLGRSDYCDYEVRFVESAPNPIESVDGALSRRHRPPAALSDVQLFWNRVLRCRKPKASAEQAGRAWVTFGGPELARLTLGYEVPGRYGAAAVWLEKPER